MPMVGVGIDIWSAIIKGGGAAALTPPLDAIGVSSTGAWATVKLRAAYAGNCMLVRRSSDNTTQDIGFVGNNLDTASLLTFVGAGNGFIRTWYDQSGNTRNLSNVIDDTQQPRIVLAGVVDTVNGTPCPKWDASNDEIDNGSFTSIVTDNTNYTAVSFARALSGSNVAGSFDCRGIYGDSNRDLWMTFKDDGGANHFFAYGNQNDSNVVTITTSYPVEGVYTGRTTAGNVRATRNGGAETVHATTGTVTGGTVYVGATSLRAAAQIMDGYIGALMFFPSALSLANLNLLCAALAPFYGQTWTTAT